MKVTQAIIAAGAAVVIGVGGGVAVARVGETGPSAKKPTAGASASPTPTPRATRSTTPRPSASPSATSSATTTPASATASSAPASSATPNPRATPVDQLSEENLVRERLYYDVTGRSLSRVPLQQDPNELLGACTGDLRFSDVLPSSGLTQREGILAASDVLRVTELMAQTTSAARARSAAEKIVATVKRCPGIQGGDFGYGDPQTVRSDAKQEVVFFPGYDSDRRFGGYIVFAVGNRVGVVDVADRIGPDEVAHLATEAAMIAAL